MFQEIEQIKESYINLQSNNLIDDMTESDTREKLVVPFLKALGFTEDCLYRERPIIRGKAIVDVEVRKNGKTILLVEVKRASVNKLDPHLYQLTSYLSSREEIEWGILTNGKTYILVNKSLKADFNQKKVLDYNIFHKFDKNTLNYFTYNYIFQNKLTHYLKFTRQYEILKSKENKNKVSFSRYYETINKYFQYLEKTIGYRDIKHLNAEDFIQFNKNDILESYKRNKPITKINTIKNRYAHIKNFYDLFEKEKLTDENPFKFNISDKELVDIYGLSLDEEEKEPLTVDEIRCILEGYEITRQPERNKLMFLLCLYCGVMREDLLSLKITDIDTKKKTITFRDKTFVLPQEFINRIENYIFNIRNKEFNSDYFFPRKYRNSTEEPLSISAINTIIKKAESFLADGSNSREVQINPEKIKGMLAKKLFEAGFTLEEIISITGISLGTLSAYINTESIIERAEVKMLDKRHPYRKLFKEF
ncbi:tyrosine-type recombinase/integrase [Geosporobacter ferrireducens]|uniref:Tyr recombinase domain-containing protein n=1 Tax=Geosporobacter ferrireducens TaxID=1424294 RepID=A0A1D8GBM2_9FIRM|nr:tyrosine-type recombinase/integrase [Geosporobacter ferrireducens]AOT68302.1 hypothetical protein Gferi_01080 [Geosporobacter ferrireducens]